MYSQQFNTALCRSSETAWFPTGSSSSSLLSGLTGCVVFHEVAFVVVLDAVLLVALLIVLVFLVLAFPTDAKK